MNSKLIMFLLAALVALPLAGCDKKKEKEDGEKAKAEQAAEKEEKEKEEEEEEEEPEGITVEQFSNKLVPTACKAVAECKNEEVRAAASTMIMFAAGMSAMKDKEFQKKLKPIQETMKKEERFHLNEGECKTVFSGFTGKTGMSADVLKAKVGKTIEFDPVKAQECLDKMETVKACEKAVKLEKKLEMKEIDKILQASNLQEDLKACETAIVGTVAEGENCEYGYECKGEETKCSAPKDAKPEEGKEPQKTCQKKMSPKAPK